MEQNKMFAWIFACIIWFIQHLIFFFLDKTIFVVGGEGTPSQGSILEIEAYDTLLNKWSTVHTLPKGIEWIYYS